MVSAMLTGNATTAKNSARKIPIAELRKHEVDISEALAQLPDLLKHAKNSRERITAATGQTGAMQQWLREFDADLSAVQGLQATFHAAVHDYHALSNIALEENLVESHRLRAKIDQYADKYRAALAADDRERDHIRAAHAR